MRLPTEKRGFEISYAEFWRLYLDAHRKPATRAMHYLATVVGAAGTLAAVLLAEPLLCPAGIGLGVCMAVGSHRFIEHNRPLIRVNAFYGAVSDLRMMWLGLTGQLPAEYRRLGLEPAVPAPGLGAAVSE
ncbi:MAG TPA: DUF962 domain-containing protein [Dongiaceae bacterium]|nr:DUF962 domain-containing protein [Dongiaceae bacterium]HVZ00369.1 DUF962 domain-containing protein [Dongiaceae bacterium]